jgi:hypothetical protein
MSLRLPPNEYAELCAKVLARDEWRCRHCKFRQNLHVHHIVFRSEMGPDETWNLVTLCHACHSGVHQGKLYIDEETPGKGADSELIFTRCEGWRPE